MKLGQEERETKKHLRDCSEGIWRSWLRVFLNQIVRVNTSEPPYTIEKILVPDEINPTREHRSAKRATKINPEVQKWLQQSQSCTTFEA